jgi:hypothetical protein
MNNHLSPKTIEHKRKTETLAAGNPGPGLRQAQKCVSTWTHYKAANTNSALLKKNLVQNRHHHLSKK